MRVEFGKCRVCGSRAASVSPAIPPPPIEIRMHCYPKSRGMPNDLALNLAVSGRLQRLVGRRAYSPIMADI